MSKDTKDLGMYRVGDTDWPTISVGNFLICEQSDGKVWIERRTGEGGEFSELAFERAIDAFYNMFF